MVSHHATLYGPDVPGDNFIDILVFDNGAYRSFDLATAHSPLESYSMVVHYRIDEASMTVEQVWEYGKERGADTFSSTLGSAYLLSNGDVLGTWGAIARDAGGNPLVKIGNVDTNTDETKIIEVDPSNNEVVFESTVTNAETYRVLRAGFYDGYSEENDILSTPLNNTSGNDLVDRSVMAWRDVKRWTNTVPVLITLKRLVRQILAAIR